MTADCLGCQTSDTDAPSLAMGGGKSLILTQLKNQAVKLFILMVTSGILYLQHKNSVNQTCSIPKSFSIPYFANDQQLPL